MKICFILLFFVFSCYHSRPEKLSCSTVSLWKPGNSFGHMLVEQYTKPKDPEECYISGAPKRFRTNKVYEIRVKSSKPLGHKLVVSNGQLKASRVHFWEAPSIIQTKQCGYKEKQKESSYLWVAPNHKEVTKFSALCGQFVGPMLVAKEIEIFGEEFDNINVEEF